MIGSREIPFTAYAVPGIKNTRVNPDLNIDTIATIVCDHFKVNKSIALSKSRKREIVKVRQFICYFSRGILKLSLEYIANYVNIDHSTVMYSVDTITNLIGNNRVIRDSVKTIENKFRL